MDNRESFLNAIRAGITDIDEQLISLLAKRRALSLEVAKHKQAVQKPIRDLAREQQLLRALIAKGQSCQLEEQYITNIFHTIIEDSVLYQQRFLQNDANPNEGLTPVWVAFLGEQGSYSHLAGEQFFARRQSVQQALPCVSFKQVLEQVETGHADYGILPIENTSSGSINEVYDLLQQTHLAIVGEVSLAICHELLAVKDTPLDSIKHIYSHPQPYQQCSEFLRTLPNQQLYSCSSSVAAIVEVAKQQRNDIAAIGNIQAGKLHGLTSLRANIANQVENYTRFIVVARKAIKVSSLVLAKTTFIMATAQQAGSLVDCLAVLKKYQINMTKLESRPVIGNPWQELFYVDVEGNLRSETMQQALNELQLHTRQLRVLGCYPIENIKPVEV